MNSQLKNIIIGLIAAVFLIISTLSSFRIMFVAIFPQKEIKTMIYDFFMESIDKAVKFEEAEFDYEGNVVLRKFNLSATSDFNDNLSLIQCDKAVITLKFIPLLTGRTVLSGIEFYDPEVNIYKRYGKSYYESFTQLINMQKLLNNLNLNEHKSIKIEFFDATFYYREDFLDDKILIELFDINCFLLLKPQHVFYRIKGLVKPYKNELIKRGYLFSRGRISLKEKGTSEIRIGINNADLTYFNEYMKEYITSEIATGGGLSIDLTAMLEKGNIQLTVKIETSNLNIYKIVPPQYTIVSNENMDLHFNASISPELDDVKIEHFRFSNGIFDFNGSGYYSLKDNEKDVRFKLSSNRIKLDKLSNYFSPVMDMHYGGELKIDSDITYDRKANSLKDSSLKLELKKFRLLKTREGETSTVLADVHSRFNLTNDKLSCAVSGRSGNSDFSISSYSTISGLLPFKSSTELTISSNLLDFRIPFLGFINGLEMLHKYAKIDSKRGYENIFFTQKPAGILVNNNDLNLNLNINRLYIREKASLKNISLRLKHHRGMLTTEKFSCEGYNGFYNFFTRGVFSVEFPFFQVGAMIDDFDVESFAADCGYRGMAGGNLAVDLDYQLTAYRMSQYLDNSEGVLTVRLDDGYFRNSQVQKKLESYLKKNGYPDISLDSLESVQFSGALTRMGDDYYFRNIQVNENTLNCRGNGTYTYDGGINLPLYCSVRNENSFSNIPLKFSREILSPCVKLYQKGDRQELCFSKKKGTSIN